MSTTTAKRPSESHKRPQWWSNSAEQDVDVVAQCFSISSILNVFDVEAQTVETQVIGWVAHIKEAIYRVPEVESAYITVERDHVDVWIIIPERDTRVLEQIADVQWKLLEDFGPLGQMPFLIELHVIYRGGRSEKELIPESARVMIREAS